MDGHFYVVLKMLFMVGFEMIVVAWSANLSNFPFSVIPIWDGTHIVINFSVYMRMA